MNKQCLITVIVPVYNCEKYIGICIESVQNQSFNLWNLILVDDGSLDNSGRLCDEYASKDDRIKVLHVQNGGPGHARNCGIKECKSVWFTFLDSDDVIESEYLANFHVERLSSNTSLSIQGFKRVSLDGMELGETLSYKNISYQGPDFLEKAFVESDLFAYGQSCGKLYNKVVVDQNELSMSEVIRHSEDQLFYLQYLLHVTDIQLHSGSMYCYQFTGEQSLTHIRIPYEEGVERFVCLEKACLSVIEKHKLTNRDILNKIYYYYMTGGISIILQSLYKEEFNNDIRVKVLELISDKIKENTSRFNPNGVKGKLLKYCILWVPLHINDKLLAMLF